MCGICGVFDLSGRAVPGALIHEMSSALVHRGPDGSGSYVCGQIGLGHRRLSIIDLGGGTQPMTNEDGTLQVVFNGEIYNYVELRKQLVDAGHIFKTNSDTEVILHAYEQWGLDFVNRFNGIFAFALWNSKSKSLILARDHLGVKPLYYTLVGRRLLFASEIKSLLRDPQTPVALDIRAMSELFTLRYVPSPDTLFEGIKKIPPAHLMVVDTTGIKVNRYWHTKPTIGIKDERSLVEEYQNLLEDAVRLQMRSDVPVGLFLSSGIDSGALLAIMSQQSTRPVHTFTIGFEDGGKRNETTDARELAKTFGADHSEMIVGAKDYQRYYEERYLWDVEEPVGNETAAAFYFVSRLAKDTVKVALTGQGADEPWAGYGRHLGAKLSGYYSRLPISITNGIVRPLVEHFARNESIRRGVNSLSERDPLSRFVKIYSFFSSEMKEKLFQPWVREQISTDGEEAKQALGWIYRDVEELDPLTQILYMDTRSNLPDDLLMVGDKTSMANSIEARVPLLDYRIVEFAESLRPDLRLNRLQSKYLHKKAIERWLPKNVIHRKKKGFSNPVDRWLRVSMRDYVREYLLSDSSATKRYFNHTYIREILLAHESGNLNYMRQINLLVSFEIWHRRFIRG
jgi:asparagine synthase (glutamine-hydrolysing)